jgi:hypothetical protein
MTESVGVGGPSGDIDQVQYDAFGSTYYGPTVGRIDWDADGDTGATTGDAAAYSKVDAETGAICTVLHNYNDWLQTHPAPGVTVMQHLQLGFQCNTKNWQDGAAPLDGRSWGEQGTFEAIAHHTLYPPVTVHVEVRPDCATHFVAPGAHGTVPVVVFGSSTFNVHNVVDTSLRFAGAPAGTTTFGDVDGDFIDDLTVEFDMQAIHLAPSDTFADLGGYLTNSQLFGGRAAVTVVSAPGPVVAVNQDANGFTATLSGGLDHRLVGFTLDNCVKSIVDRCGTALVTDSVAHIVHITSDELASGAAGNPEMVITSPTSFQVRHDRNGSGDGRVYTVTFEVDDRWQDPTRTTCRIQVPHDAGSPPAGDSGAKVCVGDGC